MINVEIRKKRTSMELLEKVLDDKNLFGAYKQDTNRYNQTKTTLEINLEIKTTY